MNFPKEIPGEISISSYKNIMKSVDQIDTYESYGSYGKQLYSGDENKQKLVGWLVSLSLDFDEDTK